MKLGRNRCIRVLSGVQPQELLHLHLQIRNAVLRNPFGDDDIYNLTISQVHLPVKVALRDGVYIHLWMQSKEAPPLINCSSEAYLTAEECVSDCHRRQLLVMEHILECCHSLNDLPPEHCVLR